MNVVIEQQPNCQATLRVELPADRVGREWDSVAKDFQRMAKVPGYRPGKTPQAIINSRFAKDIKEEVTRKLVNDTIREAIQEKNLKVISVSKVDEVEIGQDNVLRYTAVVVTSPEFELPDYSKIDLELAQREVTEADIDRVLDEARQSHATFEPIEGRGAAMDDFAVLTYQSFLEGKPLTEAAPKASPILQGRNNFWIKMSPESLLDGFCDALIGANVGETRKFDLTLGENFPLEDLRGKVLSFEVTLNALNKQNLPEWTDDLAKTILPDHTVAMLREKVKENLEENARQEFERAKRTGALQTLLAKFECELPTQIVNQEMTGMLRDIVQENQARGVSEEEIRTHQDQILGAAQQGARERVRGNFLLLRIAEKENLAVSEQEIVQRVSEISAHYQIPIKKLIKDIQRRNGFGTLREQILVGKALDLITANVNLREPVANPAQAS